MLRCIVDMPDPDPDPEVTVDGRSSTSCIGDAGGLVVVLSLVLVVSQVAGMSAKGEGGGGWRLAVLLHWEGPATADEDVEGRACGGGLAVFRVEIQMSESRLKGFQMT
jgi:hypothetical protein